ncbi:MAG TPA: shikimate kinase [bacterium]|nr:shikimate kinase [bacterium]
MKLILAGFNGTWRKESGIILSKRLGRSFFDIEQMIEEKEKDRIAHISQVKGIDYLKKLQHQAVKQVSHYEECIISVPADIFSDETNTKTLKSSATIIWLTADVSIILLRLYPGWESKSLLKKQNALTHIKQMLKQQDFSHIADRIIDTSSFSPEETVDMIQQLLTTF